MNRIEQTYNRYPSSDKGLDLVNQGIQENIFAPQSHGREYLQVNWWMQELQNENSFTRKVFENEYFFLGVDHLNHPKRGLGIGAAFDVWDKQDIESIKIVSRAD